MGDELDEFHGSGYSKGSDYTLTPREEIKIAREKIREWGYAFPKLRLAISNHGIRWLKKASDAEIPEQLLRSYQEMFDMPPGWKWQDKWIIEASRHKFLMIHGMQYGGMYAYRNAPLNEGMSTVFGHLHSSAGIAHIKTQEIDRWGMNVGCLIDETSFAFKYGRYNKLRPNIGIGAILNGGTMPIWIPFEP